MTGRNASSRAEGKRSHLPEMELSRLSSNTISAHPWGQRIQRVLAAALRAAEPQEAVRGALTRRSNRLIVADRTYILDHYQQIFLISIGKAGAPMAEAVVDLLGGRLSGGIILTKDAHDRQIPGLNVYTAGHPIPDERGVLASTKIIELLHRTGAQDLVICLLSGGGSALMTAPAAGISLNDLQQLTELLLSCGADIGAINTLRKHLDQLKGGNLARLAQPAQLLTLVLSDVIGDSLDVIASGPTVPDPTTYQDAMEVLIRYGILEKTPAAIRQHLTHGCAGKLPETPKPGTPLFDRTHNLIVGNNALALQAGLEQARREGFEPLLLTATLQGEARDAGRWLASQACDYPIRRPACLAAGGETTVTLKGNGLGGRNQEIALGAVTALAEVPGALLVTLATDGGDGPTDAAGAVVSTETLRRAAALGLDPQAYLEQNDSYHFFEALGDLLKTGPTLTNVNDLAFLFLFPPESMNVGA